MKIFKLTIATILFAWTGSINAQIYTEVGIYRTFERSIENNNPYTNKFSNVELSCKYISPAGDTTDFIGFFDGNGAGGGDSITGNIWKVRFMPDTVGQWIYAWSWSDTTTGGQDTFLCVTDNAGKGILKAYEDNPHWFAYNGKEPVWIKSYYESGHGAISQPFDWVTENVYQPLIDNGYNHLQVNWLLSLCCFSQFYNDGPAQSTTGLTLYQSGKASSTMRLDVWKLMEQNVAWLNDHNIGLHMFLGFDGGRNGGPAWTALSGPEKEFYVKYVIARLAPYANIAGWSYVWEVPGDRLEEELGWAQLVKQYDVFDHLRTYEDEKPDEHEYNRPEYNFAAVENHNMFSTNRDIDRNYWIKAWTHHNACLAGYVPGKPVIMIEGNALWRRYWQPKMGATQDDLRQSAWGCATAGASFIWCGHAGESTLMAYGPEGLPFHGDINSYATSAMQIDILTNIMNNELNFYSMSPSDSLLSGCDPLRVWCLSDSAGQYLVFTTEGDSFKLELAAGKYNSNQWINTKTGAGEAIDTIAISVAQSCSFTPPDTINDWVLLVRNDWKQNITGEANIISAETDTSGLKIFVTCNKEMNDPVNFHYGFKIRVNGSTTGYTIDSISYDTLDKEVLILEVNTHILTDDDVLLSYSGTLKAIDSSVLASVADCEVTNNSLIETGVFYKGMNKIRLNLFPNPCFDNLTVSSNEELNSIKVLDITGKPLLEVNNINRISKQISLSDIPTGLYLLSITSKYSSTVHKIIKE